MLLRAGEEEEGKTKWSGWEEYTKRKNYNSFIIFCYYNNFNIYIHSEARDSPVLLVFSSYTARREVHLLNYSFSLYILVLFFMRM